MNHSYAVGAQPVPLIGTQSPLQQGTGNELVEAGYDDRLLPVTVLAECALNFQRISFGFRIPCKRPGLPAHTPERPSVVKNRKHRACPGAGVDH